MTRNEVLKVVNKSVTYHWKPVDENSFLYDLDSLDMAGIAFDMERDLNIHFDDAEFEKVRYNIKSVKGLVDLACKKLNIPVNDIKQRTR